MIHVGKRKGKRKLGKMNKIEERRRKIW